MHTLNRCAVPIGLLSILLYAGATWLLDATPYLIGINALQSFAALYATALLLAAYRTTKAVYWLYYSVGALCYFFAQMYWTLYLIVAGTEPEAFGIPEILWMVQYVFYLMALHYQNKANDKKPLIRFVLDVLLFTTVSATMYWRFFIEPLLSGLSDEEILFNLFCSTANAVILFGLLVLYLYERVRMGSKATLLLMLGFLLKSCGNTAALYLGREDHWSEALVWVPELCWFAGLMLVGFSAITGGTANSLIHSVRQHGLYPHGHYGFGRYIPLAAVCLMCIVLMLSGEPISVTMAGLVMAFLLLLLRLLAGIRDFEAADTALQESIHNYRDLVENSLFGVFIEQNGVLVYVNPYCVELFGYETEEIIGKPLSDFLSAEEHRRLREEFHKLDVHQFTPRLCFEWRKKDRSVVYVDLQASMTFYQGKKAVSGTLLDITERKVSEELLVQSVKLSVVGQLAAGVAHEIRNPLTALKGFTQLLYQNTNTHQNYYEIMLTELERINYIVGEFMVLSKPQQWQQLNDHDLQKVLEGIIPIIESQAIIHSIEIQVEWQPKLPTVRCDANQIKQVFINLLKNSIEAMPDGGTITVRFEHVLKDEGDEVIVFIEDMGTGIPEEILSRLGEPFFTTKETGTGLGLMVCYKIIQAHGGTLTIDSKPESGTVVRISLPAER
jgi:two-component system sporulation sensor kinase A